MALLVGIALFFVVIALTLVMGGISRMGDKRVRLEGRPTKGQRVFTRRNVPAA